MKLNHEFAQSKDFFEKPRPFQINIHILDWEKFIVQLRARGEIHFSDHYNVTWPQQRVVYSDYKQDVNNSLLIKMREETETHVMNNIENASPKKFLECTLFTVCYCVSILIGGCIFGLILACKCKLE